MESYWVAIVPFQSFADSSHRGIIERHVQGAQSPTHFAESAAPWKQSVARFNELQKQKLANNLKCCLRKHYH